ncbi:Serine/threonine-protein kinase 19 [Nymphaea thermarum]|nr:Serine/threonine-protein kinase 19 [Nymphaea thermarum]
MENESPGRRKRARDEEAPQDDSLSLEDHLTFSDTMVALRIMRTQFPKMEKVSVEPFILRSQLYSSVKDRTQVDRELESLRKEKVLRIFKLNTGQDDQAVMFMDDYLKQGDLLRRTSPATIVSGDNLSGEQMDSAVKRVKAKDPADVVVFEWFKMYVITSNLDVGIGHHELCFLLSSAGNVKDDHISLLINAGLVTRQLADSDMYWFSIPNIGSLLKGLSQGRKELMSFMKRRKYKEMMLALLEKKRLRFSQLDIRFHLRDLIGAGLLKTVETPTGLLVRVAKD